MNANQILNAAEALAASHGFAPADRLAYHVGMLESEIRNLCYRINTFTGDDVVPRPGCLFTQVEHAGVEFLAEYEYSPGSAPVYDVESRVVGPGSAPSAIIIQVLVNGKWIDPCDFPNDEAIDRWVNGCIETACSDEREHIDYLRSEYA